jgi:hypothetical protein
MFASKPAPTGQMRLLRLQERACREMRESDLHLYRPPGFDGFDGAVGQVQCT